jgi:hypothetical protein
MLLENWGFFSYALFEWDRRVNIYGDGNSVKSNIHLNDRERRT